MAVRIVQRPHQIFTRFIIRSPLRQRFKGLHTALLHVHILCVFQRQVHEHAHHLWQRQVIAPVHSLQGQRQGQRVSRKTLRRIAMDIAGELVKQQHQRQPLPGALLCPMWQRAAQSRFHRQTKAFPQLLIKRGRLGKPLLLVLQSPMVIRPGTAQPVRQHLIRQGGVRNHSVQRLNMSRFCMFSHGLIVASSPLLPLSARAGNRASRLCLSTF